MKFLNEKVNKSTVTTIFNRCGLKLVLTTNGAGIREVYVPDKNGDSRIVTHRPLDEEVFYKGYHGKTIGRTSGRIANATFSIDDKTAVLEKNNRGVDNLHGGAAGLHDKEFALQVKPAKEYTDVIYTYHSPDGDGGYFGAVDFVITYRVYEDENKFAMIFDATCDQPTLLNLTNHVYWNMGGDCSENCTTQILYIDAPYVGKLNERLIIEEIVPVSKEFDFRTPHAIGDYVDTPAVQKYTAGYDHPWFFESADFNKVRCTLHSNKSGIRLNLKTTYPCVVYYGDNFPVKGEICKGVKDQKYHAVCLECEYNPDGIHTEPDNCGVTTPEKPYHEVMEFTFDIVE